MSPRWPDHDEFMPVVRELIGRKRLAGEPARIRDVQDACPGIGPRRARTLLAEAQALEPRGRPWPEHREYMRDLRLLIMQRRRDRQAITPDVVMRALGVGRDLAYELLAEAGSAAGGATDDELLPWVRAIAERDGLPVSPAAVVRELRVHHRRAVRLLARIPGALAGPVPPANVPGSSNRNAKLSEEDVRTIKAEIAEKATLPRDEQEEDKGIAGRYGVHESTVSHIRHGRRWAHVDLAGPA